MINRSRALTILSHYLFLTNAVSDYAYIGDVMAKGNTNQSLSHKRRALRRFRTCVLFLAVIRKHIVGLVSI